MKMMKSDPRRELIDQVPAKDRAAIMHLALYGVRVVIRWTNEGWRYDVEGL